MKINYITNARIPTDWAHGIQIVKTCEALALQGVILELWTPRKKLTIKESPFLYYKVKKEFPIRRVFTLDLTRLGKFGFLIQTLSFAAATLLLLSRKKKQEIAYCRDEIIAASLLFFGLHNTIWESHDGAWNRWARYTARHTRSIVVVSEGLKAFYVEKGIPAAKIHVVRNGITLEEFTSLESGPVSRRRLGLPEGKKIALYVGMLQGWKGADVLLRSADFLSPDTILAVIGGESEQYVAALSREYSHVRFLGYRPQAELPDNLSSADVLVLSNTAKNEVSARFTSPLKLFAYMAANKPIVLPDLPSMREIVDDESAYFVEPDDPKALAEGIEAALANPIEAQKRSAEAFRRAQEFSWEKRAQRIIQVLGPGV